MLFLYVILTTIILYWAAVYLKISNSQEYKKSILIAFKTMLSFGVFAYAVSFLNSPVVVLSLFFLIYFIKYFYKLDVKKATKLWLFYILFLLPVLLVLAVIATIPDFVEIF